MVLNVVPGAPDAEDGPAPRDDVQRRDDLGQDTGVAIGHAGDKRAELHPPGPRSQRPEQGVRLQHRLVRPAQGRQLEEVIHDPHRVEPGFFGRRSQADDMPEQVGRIKSGEVRQLHKVNLGGVHGIRTDR
jgi:hypothetical protein